MIVEFTHEELERYTKKQLITLCRFYNLPVNPGMSKPQIIDILWNIVKPEENYPEMSVRIRRIYLQNRSN